MRNFALWCLWTLPASLIFASVVGSVIALASGAMPHLSEPAVLLNAIGFAAPVQPLLWLILAAWVATTRLQPKLEESWTILVPAFLLWFVSINSLITVAFYGDELGLMGLLGFALLGTFLLVPRFLHASLGPGAFQRKITELHAQDLRPGKKPV